MNNKGFFLVIEGPNGAGKSSLCKLIAELWQSGGGEATIISEPSNTAIGSLVREYRELPEHAFTLACLLAADRYRNLICTIRPAKAKGHLVLADRYFPSMLVYQRMHGLSMEFVKAINAGIDLPDLTVLLDVDVDTLTARLVDRKSDSYSENIAALGREVELYRATSALLRDLGYVTSVFQPKLGDQLTLAREILDRIKQTTFKDGANATSI
ncbi:MAG: dTMP kinase [Bryobacterales bacterium]|nr:dTMP kinase [Bryobacterales bacterium]